ncbi:hypothetical protein KY334_07395 [Candidatus Woesearchaeota archaeon]|nr:hypothetical protein [Candidatus Woesearchaeota archaeon]
MVWQDIVISIANVLFTFSLLNQVIHGFRSKKTSITYLTSGLTTIGLIAMTTAFFSLGLYYSGFSAGTNALLWFILFIQRILY